MTSPRSWKRSLRALRNSPRREADAPREAPREERCELCAHPLTARHRHLIDPTTRNLICSCDGCSILFDSAGKTQYRRIPRDAKLLPELDLPDGNLQNVVPIGLAFFYRSSHAGRIVGIYPSSAGVTETLVDDAPWKALTSRNPVLEGLQEDVEALLVNRLREQRLYFIAPMDRCFELVGLIRKHWQGFSGGDRVQEELARFFTQLKEGAHS